MTSDAPQQYEVTLVPQGVAPEEANETRTYTFTSSEDEPDLIRDARSYITSNDLLDKWALRNHWEIHTITRLDDTEDAETTPNSSLPPAPAEQLHDALHACSYTSAALARSYTSISITIKNPRTDQWHPTTLAIRPKTKQQFFDWRRDLTKQHAAITNAHPRVLHEAMVHVAADVKPTLVNDFDNDPLTAQHEFVQIAIAHPDKIVKEVKSLSP